MKMLVLSKWLLSKCQVAVSLIKFMYENAWNIIYEVTMRNNFISIS